MRFRQRQVLRLVEPGELAPQGLFLLFAGPDDRPEGGLSDLVATFATEPDARAAFRGIRLSGEYRNGWAELAEIGANGRIRALCWFGPRRARFARKDTRPGARPAVR